MGLTIINADAVRRYLPMAECIDVMADAMAAASERSISIPPRSFSSLTDNSGMLGVMPGLSAKLGNYGAKLISLHPGNPAQGRPAIQGFVALFDHSTGALLAIVEGSQITAIRTAAASGLATRLLAREDASSCGILGTGVQAQTHIDAVCAVRPIAQVLVWGRDAGRTRDFAAAESQRCGLEVRAVANAEEAAACDVVSTVTGALEPVLMGQWVKPGAHINLVGSHSLQTREADTALMQRAAIYVDLMDSARKESGDIMIPVQQGALREEDIVGEIGKLVGGDIPGRMNGEQITLYKSLGITAQDLYAARYVYDKAMGTAPVLDW